MNGDNMSKDKSFLDEATDSIIIGAIACSIFKGIALIFKIIGLIIFWPIALFIKPKSRK